MLNLDLPFALRIVLTFLIGAIPFAVVAMWGSGIDITKVGSKNPGFNNVLRVAGKRRAAIALLGDVSKGWLALWLLSRPEDSTPALWLLGLAVVVGHCWTPLLGFQGGKGVATSTGVLFYLEPLLTLVFPVVYVPARKFGQRRGWTQEGAIASLLSLLVVTAIIFGFRGVEAGKFALALLVLVTLRHTSNLREVWAEFKSRA